MEENLVGLHAGSVRQVKFVLSNVCGDIALGEYYEQTVLTIQRLVGLIMCEISSAKKDLAYWEGLAGASSLELAYMRSQLYVYRMITGNPSDESGGVPLSSRLRMTKGKIDKVLRRLSAVMITPPQGVEGQEGGGAASSIPFEKNMTTLPAIGEHNNNNDGRYNSTASASAGEGSPHRHRRGTASGLYLSSRADHTETSAYEIFDNVEKQVFVLRFDLQQLSCMLASVKEAADHLKRIFNEVAVTTQRTVTSRAKHQPSFLHPALADQFHSFAKEHIRSSLQDLSSTIKTYDLQPVILSQMKSPMHALDGAFTFTRFFENVTLSWCRFNEPKVDNEYSQHVDLEGTSAFDKSTDETFNEIKATSREIENLVMTLRDGEYPLQITDSYARRPSHLERLWLRDLLVLLACAATASKLNGLYHDGTLKQMYVSCVEILAHGVKDHIIEPLTDLSKYLFERLKNDAELIVTRKELKQSKEDLRTMLDGYRKLYEKSSTSVSTNKATDASKSTHSGVTQNKNVPKAANVVLSPPTKPVSRASPTAPSSADLPQPQPQPDTQNIPQMSENSMLPILAESLKSMTDSASAKIDSILKKMQDTRESIDLNPDLSEFELNSPTQESNGATAQNKPSKMNVANDAVASLDDAGMFDDNIDQAMDSLMNRYVREIESPVKGMLFGSLVTGALIQMQKVKVMSEASMMRMDQVLASNQLTMAGTAAMPALLLLSGVSLFMRKIFSSSPPSHGEKTLRLRLALTSVERSLQSVYSLKRIVPHASTPADTFSEVGSTSRVTWDEKMSSPRHIRERNSSAPDLGVSMAMKSPLKVDVDYSANSSSSSNSLDAPGTPDSRGAPHRATFKYSENGVLINRGSLCFNIIMLRNELRRAFAPRYQRNLSLGPKWDTARPRQSLVRLLYRMLFGEVSDFDDELEYQAIIDDITNLEAPDDEVDGLKKISIATRMRSSYRCFNI
jgi:hypothetical protein